MARANDPTSANAYLSFKNPNPAIIKKSVEIRAMKSLPFFLEISIPLAFVFQFRTNSACHLAGTFRPRFVAAILHVKSFPLPSPFSQLRTLMRNN